MSVRENVRPRRGMDCEIPRRLEKGMSVSENARPRESVDCEIPHRLERRTSAKEDAGPKGGWIVRSHIGWRNKTFFIRAWKPLPSRHVLDYLLTVGLDYYTRWLASISAQFFSCKYYLVFIISPSTFLFAKIKQSNCVEQVRLKGWNNKRHLIENEWVNNMNKSAQNQLYQVESDKISTKHGINDAKMLRKGMPLT